MLDLKFIRENPAKVEESIRKRNLKLSLSDLLSLDVKRSSLLQKIQALREERNQLGKENDEKARQRGRDIKEELKLLEPELSLVDKELKLTLSAVPNLLHKDVPLGKDETNNVVVRQHGEKKEFSFKPQDHIEIGKKLALFDFERGVKVSGSNFYFFKNEMVILEIALIRFALDFLKSRGFSLFLTPDLAKFSMIEGTGFSPKGPETQVYTLNNFDLGLIGTSEITLAGYKSGETVEEDKLPLKYAGLSHCFRTEAGGYGRESRGLYRVHQFSKVEMFVFSLPSKSDETLDYLLSLEEEIHRQLGLTYRVVEICSGDLGAPAFRKFDIEVWLPGMNKWGELTSASNCTDYQSRRLKIKYKDKDNLLGFVHTLNGTAITSSRLPIAILENYQKEDGSVEIPEVLQKYTGYKTIKPHVL